MMGVMILWPARHEALHRPDGSTDGYDLDGATVIEVEAGFSWPGHRVDWAACAIVEDLSAIKADLCAAACEMAETARNRFITPGSGQAITYARKEAEARSWAPGGEAISVPFLAAEAEAIGATIDDLAALVVAQADAWVAAGAAIEARRRGLMVAIQAAETRTELDAIDIAAGWPTSASSS